jgi:phosphatidate cytidylyltransferase
VLKYRLITASVLASLLVWGILSLETGIFAATLAVFVVLAAWEWSALSGWASTGARFGYTLSVIVAMWLGKGLPVVGVMGVSLLWWVVALVWVGWFSVNAEIGARLGWLKAMVGILVLVSTWLVLIHLHTEGEYYLLILLALIWAADSGAYFAGQRWGRTRLAPKVSPGKSREGLYAALAVTFLLAVGTGLGLGLQLQSLVEFVFLGVLTVLYSVLGDLFESMLKRQVGVKDSGHLLPGHGGMLDRIDSLLAAAPIFGLGLYLMGLSA